MMIHAMPEFETWFENINRELTPLQSDGKTQEMTANYIKSQALGTSAEQAGAKKK